MSAPAADRRPLGGRALSVALRRLRRPGAAVGLLLFALLGIAAALAPVISPHPPTAIDFLNLQKPPSGEYLLGTDDLGRSVLSRVLYGIRTSFVIGFSAVAIALSIGLPLGLVAGYYGGRLDGAIVRILEIDLAFPSILLALAAVAVLGPGTRNTAIAIAIATIPIYALTARSATKTIIGLEYVQAARALGARDPRILLRHVLPGVVSPLLIVTTVQIGNAVLAAAGLGYLGLGAQPPTPELGTMLAEARAFLRQAWWMSVFPGLAITVMVLGLNLLGDALSDILDVRRAAAR